MRDPFRKDREPIEENAFLNQRIKEQESAEQPQAEEAPGPGYCLAADRDFLRYGQHPAAHKHS
jgi:hypothetical protein